MKSLAVLAIIIFSLAQQSTKLSDSNQNTECNCALGNRQIISKPKKEHPPATKARPVSQEMITVQEKASSISNRGESSDTNRSASPDEVGIQRKLTWFTGALTLVGVLQLVAIIWQGCVLRKSLRAMRRQTEELGAQRALMDGQLAQIEKQTDVLKQSVAVAETNAKIAQTTSQSLINNERAWIVAEIRWTTETPGLANPARSRVVERGGPEGAVSIDVCLNYKNDGKTPAWITERRILFRILDELPLSPQFEPEIFGDYYMIGPEPITVGGNATVRKILEYTGRREIGKILAVYGFIKYRDAFSSDRETRFGYIITESDELQRIAGSADAWQYNSYF